MYEPTYSKTIEKFVAYAINTNKWRLSNSIGADDLSQDSYVIFLELKEKYCNKNLKGSEGYTYVDNAEWFNTIYRSSFNNYLVSLSRSRTKEGLVSDYSDNPMESVFDRIVGDTDNGGYLESLLETVPLEVDSIMQTVSNIPTETLERIQSVWESSGKKKVMGNTYLCNMLGLDPREFNLIKNAKEYFVYG